MDNKSTLLMWVGSIIMLAGGVLLWIAWLQTQYSMGVVNTWVASILVLISGVIIFFAGAFHGKN